eukprot:1149718-Pelagomonas_calceolata.AAC.8
MGFRSRGQHIYLGLTKCCGSTFRQQGVEGILRQASLKYGLRLWGKDLCFGWQNDKKVGAQAA